MTIRLAMLDFIGSIAGCGSGSGTSLLPGENYSRKDALAGVERGKPVVRAVLRFEADTGLWPQDLAELVPEYLTADDIKTWRYHTFHHDDFALVYLGPLTGGTLHYDQDPGKPGAWNVWWEVQPEQYQPTKLNGVQSEPPPTKLSSDLQASKRLALLNRRVNATPDRIAHRIGLMKHHWDLGNLKEARAVCADCIDKWPDYWWSYLMLAKIEGRLGDQSNAERRLKGLAKRWDDFYGFAFLAQFYFDQKDVEKCKATLRQALKPQPTQLKERYTFEQIGYRQSWVDDCYYHNAAYLAYRIGDRPLCLAICDRWTEFVRDVQNYGGEEERALRVVCAVNEADWETAARLLQTMRQPLNFAPWQEDGKDGLGARASVKNKKGKWTYGDVKVGDDGNVVLDDNGMSVNNVVEEIYPGRLPEKHGGQNSNDFCVFRMGEAPFTNGSTITENLKLFYPGHDFHGMVVPVKIVPLATYRQHLEDTREGWVPHFPEACHAN